MEPIWTSLRKLGPHWSSLDRPGSHVCVTGRIKVWT